MVRMIGSWVCSAANFFKSCDVHEKGRSRMNKLLSGYRLNIDNRWSCCCWWWWYRSVSAKLSISECDEAFQVHAIQRSDQLVDNTSSPHVQETSLKPWQLRSWRKTWIGKEIVLVCPSNFRFLLLLLCLTKRECVSTPHRRWRRPRGPRRFLLEEPRIRVILRVWWDALCGLVFFETPQQSVQSWKQIKQLDWQTALF